MCLTPLHINPRYKFIQDGSFRSVTCDCNECDECRKAHSFEFYVRSYYDYRWTIENNGYVFSDCLTYRNSHLPLYNGKPCFSSDDVRRFKENFEFLCCQYILQKLGKPYNAKNRDTIAKPMFRRNIKTLVISEYGGCYHRPHYHITTFNRLGRSFLSPAVLEILIGKSWCKEKIKRKVQLFDTIKDGKKVKATQFTALGGFNSDPAYAKVVKGIGNLIYLSGYLCKDDDFYEYFKEDLKNLSIKEKNKFKPRNYYYRGFGASIFNYYSVDALLTEKVKTPAPAGSLRAWQLVAVPKYILRKIIYDKFKYEDFDKSNNKVTKYKYYYNENSVTYRSSRFYESMNNAVQEMYDTLAFADSLIKDDEKLRSLHSDNIRSIRSAGLFHLALYSMLFRCRYDDGFDTTSVECLDAPCDALEYYKYVITQRIKQTFTRVTSRSDYIDKNSYYNPLYDNLLNSYDDIKYIVGTVKNKDAFAKRIEKAVQRNQYKKEHHKSNKYLKYFNK